MRRILTMSLVIALTLISLTSPAHAADFGNRICLNANTTQCVDVKDGVYADGQPLWLYNAFYATGLGFSEIFLVPGVCAGENNSNCHGKYGPFTDHIFDILYDGDNAIMFTVTQPDEDFCIGELGGAVQLRGNCGGLNSVWIRDGNYLINVERTNTLDAAAFLISSSASDKATLTASVIETNGWKTWRITCVQQDC